MAQDSMVQQAAVAASAALLEFVEALRREPSAQGGGPRQARPRITPGLYRVFWTSGGSSECAIGCEENGDNWIAPTNWLSPGTVRQIDRNGWGGIERLEPIEDHVWSDWAPIETAPLDGSSVLLACAGGDEFAVAHWTGSFWAFIPQESGLDDGDREFGRPTHWMPLPAPPTGRPA